MNAHERAEMVIKTIKVWQFLQLLDEGIDEGDVAAGGVAGAFFARFGMTLEDAQVHGVLPFAQLKTTLALLLVTLCFARSRVDIDEWRIAGMSVKPEYALECIRPERPDIEQVMRTLRNAAAHAFEDESCVTFPEGGVVSFKSGDAVVRFLSPQGFVSFLQDYIRSVQKVALAQL